LEKDVGPEEVKAEVTLEKKAPEENDAQNDEDRDDDDFY
jgi:hypothetical protein